MIYFLEDDDSIRKLVIYALKNQGYEAQGFDRPSRFYAAVQKQTPELVLLDLMLPEEDGISVLKRLRSTPATAETPVIVITAKVAEYDRVEGLDAGADDYISKPFGMMELMARIRAVMRRAEKKHPHKTYRTGALELTPDRREVTLNGEPLSLTHKEFLLLCTLVENEGIVMSRSVLMDKVWDLGSERENRTLDVHIRTLRAKLGDAGSQIETVRGMGYKWRG